MNPSPLLFSNALLFISPTCWVQHIRWYRDTGEKACGRRCRCCLQQEDYSFFFFSKVETHARLFRLEITEAPTPRGDHPPFRGKHSTGGRYYSSNRKGCWSRVTTALQHTPRAQPPSDFRLWTLTESQEEARSRSLAGAKQTDEIPSVGGSLRSISFAPADVMAAPSGVSYAMQM